MALYDVFISYRRDGGAAEARLIQAALQERKVCAFLDVTELGPGYFDDALLKNIKAARNFVVILSPHALDRAEGDDDWLRKEIAYAIETDRNVVPLMMPGFQFPPKLPPELKNLPRHQGMDYSHLYFDAMMQKLMATLILSESAAGVQPVRSRVPDHERGRFSKWWILAAMTLCAGVAFLLFRGRPQASGTSAAVVTGSINGTVGSPQRRALGGITVSTGVASTTTSIDGHFSLAGVPTGLSTVSLSTLPSGCTIPASELVSVPANAAVDANFSVTCTVDISSPVHLDNAAPAPDPSRKEQERRRSYLYATSLPSKVDFIVCAANSKGENEASLAGALVEAFRVKGKSSSNAVFSSSFVKDGGFDSFFEGRGGSDLREMPVSKMANSLLFARVTSISVKPGASAVGLVTASVSVTFRVLSATDGSVADTFEVTAAGAGTSEPGATAAAFDRVVEQFAKHGK